MLTREYLAALNSFRLALWLRFLRRIEPRQQLLLSVRTDLISNPAASSRPAPSAPPPVDGIPSADVAPPASAETLSPVVPPKPVRFVTLKLWATRIGIVALVATGFGTFALAITWSVTGLVTGATVGAALAVRRAMRLSADDIHF